jgi:hypothetical protein
MVDSTDKSAIRNELERQYWRMAQGRGTALHLATALAEADIAISCLPCRECESVAWPVVSKPERGSADWWEDTSAYFVCRSCGTYLADRDDGIVSYEADPEYPLGSRTP